VYLLGETKQILAKFCFSARLVATLCLSGRSNYRLSTFLLVAPHCPRMLPRIHLANGFSEKFYVHVELASNAYKILYCELDQFEFHQKPRFFELHLTYFFCKSQLVPNSSKHQSNELCSLVCQVQ